MGNLKNTIIKYLYDCDIKNLTIFLSKNPGKYKFNFESDDIFSIMKKACDNKNLSIFKLLFSFSDKIDINTHSAYMFRYACKTGCEDIARYIYSTADVNIFAENNEAFYNSCYSNNTNLVVWLNDMIPTEKKDYQINDNKLFRTCCQMNLVDVCILISTFVSLELNIDNSYNDRYTHENCFHFFCRHGYLEIAKKYYKLFQFNINSKSDEAICLACQEGHTEMVEWLYSIGGDITGQDYWCIGMTIVKNNLEMFKFIYSTGVINIHENGDYIFRHTCSLGKIDIAQWIYSLGNVNSHAYFDHAFVSSCVENHLDVATWLYSLGGIDIHDDDDNLFKCMCQMGHINIAKWLYSLGDIDIHSDNEGSFRIACYMQHLEIAKWLYSLGNINIKAKGNESFVIACMNNHIYIALWLSTLNNEQYKLSIIDEIITSWSIIKNMIFKGETEINEIDDCPICFVSKCDTITNCNHQFCKDCLKKYINKQQYEIEDITCPYCRQTNLEFYNIKKIGEK